ncbi:Transposase, MuDR, plant [Sesbania bispinosa]|nr:Transposase, MuDR, plant [Sesbania bispinosa]
MKLWWKFKDGKWQNKWKEINDDDDASEVSSYVELKKCEVHFYVEHSVNQAIVTEVPKQLPYHKDDGGVTGGAGENVAGVAENDEAGENVAGVAGVTENEGVARMKGLLSRQFRFQLGMEFSSLKQFKDAILEHSMLNGRQIRYVKNDTVRVRVACSQSCEFTMLVSRVGRSTTYRVKTLVGRHTCGRVFDNNNAKASWVAKAVVNRLKSNIHPPQPEPEVNDQPPASNASQQHATQASQASAAPTQNTQQPGPKKRGRPRLATDASTSNTTNGSRQKRGNGVPKKPSHTKSKGKGKVKNTQPQQNTSQNGINPEEAVKSLYGVMLAWGKAIGAKSSPPGPPPFVEPPFVFTEPPFAVASVATVSLVAVATVASVADAINVAFKNAGINEDQIGSVQPPPVASGFETAAATLRRIQESVSEGAEVEQSVNALSQSAAILRGHQNAGGEDIQGGQAPESSARRSQKK